MSCFWMRVVFFTMRLRVDRAGRSPHPPSHPHLATTSSLRVAFLFLAVPCAVRLPVSRRARSSPVDHAFHSASSILALDESPSIEMVVLWSTCTDDRSR